MPIRAVQFLREAHPTQWHEQIRFYSDPIRPTEIFSRLKTYGDFEFLFPINDKLFRRDGKTAWELDVKKLQAPYQGHLRYLMFYRFTETVKSKFRNSIKDHKLIYNSDNWLVYDLVSE